MVFYVGMVPVLFMLARALGHLQMLKKHDHVLYGFCDIRRDLMKYLREAGSDLSAKDYAFAMDIAGLLNHTVHNYRQHKERTFIFPVFASWMKDFQASVKELERLPKVENETLGFL